MFATIGRIADRYRIPLVVGWVALAVLVTFLAPNLDEVTNNDFANFLAEDSASATGRTLIEQYFPAQLQKGSVVLVFDAGPGAKVTGPANWAFIEDISLWLVGDDAPEFIQSVLSPIASAEAAGMLIAPDEQIGMVAVALNTDDLEEQKALLDTIGERLEEAPPGLSTYRTGQTAISQE